MKVFSVNQVTVIKVSESPLRLSVQASGLTSTSGWSNPRLDNSEDPSPKDAVLEFSFDADRPEGATLQVLTPIHASIDVKPANGADAVIVKSRTNSITVHASEFVVQAALNQISTHILLESPTTTFSIGEEMPHLPTTFRLGEEIPTLAFAGGEGGTTFRLGEEGPHTDPRIDDPLIFGGRRGPIGPDPGPFGPGPFGSF